MRYVCKYGYNEHDINIRSTTGCIRLPGPGASDLENLKKRFSDDILRIVLSGSGCRYLSVSYMPGLFHYSQAKLVVFWLSLSIIGLLSIRIKKTRPLLRSPLKITSPTRNLLLYRFPLC